MEKILKAIIAVASVCILIILFFSYVDDAEEEMGNTILENIEDADLPKFESNVSDTGLTWLCKSSTDQYSCSIGQTAATCSLSYSKFLEQYFDTYLEESNDSYTVSKRTVGEDSSGKYDIYEYTFTPKNYTHTVLISGGMNACELSAEFGIAYFLKNVMEKPTETFTWLYENVQFKIIPVLCPWSFDQSPIKYENFNGVNLNKNFDYNNSWETYSAGGAGTKGDSPFSEAESHILRQWLNNNTNFADFWIDCHSDTSGIAEGATAYLHSVICSDSKTTSKITKAQNNITAAYVNAGYFASGAEKTGATTWTEPGTNYPKHLYSKNVCDIPSIMIEQYVGNSYYGGIRTLNNTESDINNYVTMLHAYVLEILS